MVDLAELRKKTRRRKEDAPAPAVTAPSPRTPPPPAPEPAPPPVRPADTPAEPAPAPPPAETVQVLAFRIGRETYGFPIDAVQEIIPPMRITPVPNAPKAIMGILSLRGVVIPVLDIAVFLGQTAAPLDPDARIIVLRSGEEILGIHVDRVEHTVQVPLARIEATPQTVQDPRGMITGVHAEGDRLLILLRPESL
jgi:purine-binding chemotaxis protein CheW